MPCCLRRALAAACGLALGMALVPRIAGAQTDPDLKAISSYTLTMPRFKQYLNGMQSLAKAAEHDPSVAQAMENSGDLSLDKAVARYDGTPAVKAAIGGAGLTSREFVLLQGALLQAGLAYGIMKEYHIPPDSIVKRTGVSRANLDFYAGNAAEIERLGKEMGAETSQARSSEDGDDINATEVEDSTAAGE
jgi:hypothetical protein